MVAVVFRREYSLLQVVLAGLGRSQKTGIPYYFQIYSRQVACAKLYYSHTKKNGIWVYVILRSNWYRVTIVNNCVGQRLLSKRQLI